MFTNYRLMKKDIDVQPFCTELSSYLKEHEWMLNRSKNIPGQRHTKHIDLRTVRPPKGGIQHLSTGDQIRFTSNCKYTKLYGPTYPFFKNTYAFLEKFADEIEGELGRAMIVSLLPHTQVYAHYDAGTYYEVRDRYHLPIQTKGSLNRCGEEEATYHEGELWWFNNKIEHEAFNDSDEERIHIIFDVLPQKRNWTKRFRDTLEKELCLLHFSRESSLKSSVSSALQ